MRDFASSGDRRSAEVCLRLGEQGALGMGDEVGVAGVGEAAVEGVEQAEALVRFAEEQGAGVGH